MKASERSIMTKNYIEGIGESKKRFHKKRASMPFEEKVKIIIELQKINAEMRKGIKAGRKNSIYKVWQFARVDM